MENLQWRSDSVCVEALRCVWKRPTRNREESRILQLVGGRHHLPPLLDVPPGVAPPMCDAFALPYLPDRSVQSIDEARLLTANVAEALCYLHSLGYVHCDVKRANVRFTGTEAFLIDLDSARRWRPGSAPLRGMAGTPSWRAPEASVDCGSFTSKVDLYGLGLVLFDELLCLYFPDFWRGTRTCGFCHCLCDSRRSGRGHA
jgi:serine/threonine protein kinase